jgi:hypothetical protein
MSQHTIGIVVDQLLTDEHLRTRFTVDRIEILAELCLLGFDFTPDEIDVFCRTDVFWSGRMNLDRPH